MDSNQGSLSQKSVLGLMDDVVGFMRNLHSLGKFPYVLFGSGFLLILLLLIPWKELQEVVSSLITLVAIISIALMLVGAALVIIDRIISYRITDVKLRFISTAHEKLVDASIREKDKIDSAVYERIAKAIQGQSEDMKLPNHNA